MNPTTQETNNQQYQYPHAVYPYTLTYSYTYPYTYCPYTYTYTYTYSYPYPYTYSYTYPYFYNNVNNYQFGYNDKSYAEMAYGLRGSFEDYERVMNRSVEFRGLEYELICWELGLVQSDYFEMELEGGWVKIVFRKEPNNGLEFDEYFYHKSWIDASNYRTNNHLSNLFSKESEKIDTSSLISDEKSKDDLEVTGVKSNEELLEDRLEQAEVMSIESDISWENIPIEAGDALEQIKIEYERVDTMSDLEYDVGDRVDYYWDGYWYPGLIMGVNESNLTYDVEIGDWDENNDLTKKFIETEVCDDDLRSRMTYNVDDLIEIWRNHDWCRANILAINPDNGQLDAKYQEYNSIEYDVNMYRIRYV